MPLRYLFIDMNAYFASVEKMDDPSLGPRPVVVVPTLGSRNTCCIAGCYVAKKYGIQTGTPVWQVEQLCPGAVLIQARPERYVRVHRQILDAVGGVIPVERVMSIDEMLCRLVGVQQRRAEALRLALAVKRAIREQVGAITCSIGIAANDLLAKVAADMHKPDGVTVLDPEDLPHKLYRLKLTDFPGIGPRMERRLNAFGVFAVQQLCGMSAAALSQVWGSKVLGGAWWCRLRGEDLPEKRTVRRTVGHSHVLPPDLRTAAGSTAVQVRLLHKAAARLRKIDYRAGSLSAHVTFLEAPAWSAGCRLAHVRDTYTFLKAFLDLWDGRPPGTPLKVGVVLGDLVPAASAARSLFDEDRRWEDVSAVMDRINARYGPTAVYFGSMFAMRGTDRNPIAFNRIPDID